MATTPPDRPPRRGGKSQDAEPTPRRLPSGSIAYLLLAKGDAVEAEDAPEIVAHVGGRGRMSWTADTPADDDPRRPWGVIFLPPGARLRASGRLSALRITLPGLVVAKPMGPVAEVLVGLLCRRAWIGSDAIAEVALRLVRLLIEDEAERRTPREDAEDR